MLLYVLPVERVEEADLGEIELVIGRQLGFETRRMSSMGIPSEAYDPRRKPVQRDRRGVIESAPAGRLWSSRRRTCSFDADSSSARLKPRSLRFSLSRGCGEYYGLDERDLFVRRSKETLLNWDIVGLTHCADPMRHGAHPSASPTSTGNGEFCDSRCGSRTEWTRCAESGETERNHGWSVENPRVDDEVACESLRRGCGDGTSWIRLPPRGGRAGQEGGDVYLPTKMPPINGIRP
jgi:hypothetical protein